MNMSEAEVKELEATVERLEGELKELQAKLEAVYVLYSTRGESLIAILEKMGKWMAPREIRAYMKASGVPEGGKWGEGYRYVQNVLHREVKKGTVARMKGKYRAVK